MNNLTEDWPKRQIEIMEEQTRILLATVFLTMVVSISIWGGIQKMPDDFKLLYAMSVLVSLCLGFYLILTMLRFSSSNSYSHSPFTMSSQVFYNAGVWSALLFLIIFAILKSITDLSGHISQIFIGLALLAVGYVLGKIKLKHDKERKANER